MTFFHIIGIVLLVATVVGVIALNVWAKRNPAPVNALEAEWDAAVK